MKNMIKMRTIYISLISLVFVAFTSCEDKLDLKPISDLTTGNFYQTQDHMDAAEQLIRRGAGVNKQDNDGITALMEAASIRSADLVGMLLTHGADVEIKDSRGRTVNDIARKRRNAKVISTLENYAEEHKIH